MVQALGYVSEAFNPAAPGRLCRGRERWIEYETMAPKEEGEALHRLILSGATFSDDRARDARRGLGFGPIPMPVLLRTVLGEGPLVAYCEEGHPHEIPDAAAGVEHHTVARPGGSLREWRVRWHKEVSTAEEIETAINSGADVFVRLATPTDSPAETIHESPLIPPLADEADTLPSLLSEELARALFFLTGFRAAGRPNRYFQPWGIPAVLGHVEAVTLLHRDKHGPALGHYSHAAPDVEDILSALNASTDTPLLVPFAIPPMLARWDRALWELRQQWDADARGEFPVPAAARPEPEPKAAPEPVVEEAPADEAEKPAAEE